MIHTKSDKYIFLNSEVFFKRLWGIVSYILTDVGSKIYMFIYIYNL